MADFPEVDAIYLPEYVWSMVLDRHGHWHLADRRPGDRIPTSDEHIDIIRQQAMTLAMKYLRRG